MSSPALYIPVHRRNPGYASSSGSGTPPSSPASSSRSLSPSPSRTCPLTPYLNGDADLTQYPHTHQGSTPPPSSLRYRTLRSLPSSPHCTARPKCCAQSHPRSYRHGNSARRRRGMPVSPVGHPSQIGISARLHADHSHILNRKRRGRFIGGACNLLSRTRFTFN